MTGSGDNGGCLFPVSRASLFPWRASLACAAFPIRLRSFSHPPAQLFPLACAAFPIRLHSFSHLPAQHFPSACAAFPLRLRNTFLRPYDMS